MTDAPPTKDAPWPVAVFADKIKGWIDRLGAAWVEGEIAQWGVSNGNVYGKLKDLELDATVSFNVWSSVRAKFTDDFSQGDRVIALLKPNYWVKGGSLSMNVLELRHVGLGDMLAQLARLKATLQAEGLFDAARKKPLPFLPQCIGLITGRDSDAEKDVVRNAQLRWPSVRFRIIHTPVQGDNAARDVTAAIVTLDADPEVDVIIIARGGGDFQNLLPFSDETLVRTAAAASTPIVSAIGHEADRPLLDDVADLRASTPTDAAKRVVPDVAEEITRVQQARTRIAMRVTSLITTEIDRLGQLRSRPVMASGDWIIDSRSEEVTRFVARGVELIDRRIERASTAIAELSGKLTALSPQGTLDRGYAIARLGDGRVVRSATDAPAGTDLTLTLADGSIVAQSRGVADGADAEPSSSAEIRGGGEG